MEYTNDNFLNIQLNNYTESFKTKKKEVSKFKLRIAANQEYNEFVSTENFSRSALQNFCRSVNEKTFEQLTNRDGKTYKEFAAYVNEKNETVCYSFEQLKQMDKPENKVFFAKVSAKLKLESLNIPNDQILFSHLDTYGKEKELNTKDGKKQRFSLNLFFTCLERFKASENGQKSKDENIADDVNGTGENKESPETVNIKETALTPAQKGKLTRLRNSLNAGKLTQAQYEAELLKIAS